MTIDADGSPHAYHPDDSPGLDYLRNARKPGAPGEPWHWWGIVLGENREPQVQKPPDPAPGFYVSSTSLVDPTKRKETDPTRYVDSESIPFIALPPNAIDLGEASLGDFCTVINRSNSRIAFAIFADGGPADHLGEGSIALAEALNVKSSPRKGGAANGIIYVVFPRSGDGKPKEIDEIKQAGRDLFKAWGGMDRVDEIFPV